MSRWSRGPVGLVAGVAGVAALAAGGAALGFELEKRMVGKRLAAPETDVPAFFSLHASGPRLITSDGVSLHVEVDEAAPYADVATEPPLPDGWTIVFVHGFALSLDCWHFQRQHFRGRARLVLYDLRSHGRSGRSGPKRSRLGQLADDLHQVLDEVVGEVPVVLVGHSMGAMTIMRLARTHPELFGPRVRGVALLSTAGGEMADYSPIKSIPGKTFSRVFEPLLAALNRAPRLVEQGRRAGSDLAHVITARMAFGSEVPPSSVEFVSEMLSATPLQVIADFYPGFAELDETEGFMALTRVPVEIIGGADDMVTLARHTEKMIELMPSARGHVLQHTGHLSMIEHPHTVNALLDELIDRTTDAST